ncbi:2-succinyl-5-enolpyruvyl-6-hydroxy-3-cyclohexene-1-carboxylic-acid synthase [Actinomyces sp. HPA0247]|uniref:2-succinyl-5-enolpyruvyl-6-hydroxy-3- cyclohexene-1-carboxylic-acid synthase n=1 Tax=Actinomyces sp. HPA0247 TaxID=1203556 RepID=UPI00034E68CC|nr:2-succinyl-5-enolpyruvyl-6-hydroxy-3-cyclohexene-1-carboxylic-acid synthase [Actinomyces sp. HPA0247]EPD72943.1 2-succinyl-5-enolpyruvyl-6-hydroxy-3-cyclohexene-1-carboxylic-acid synthase [Actinomyces sp. HPA0247]
MPSVDTASAILASLDALGLTHVLYCPGSRSAPFAYALEAGAFSGDARAVLDERGAGFMAVGLARTGALPAIVVTSGTAVAELAPAVLEASHARLPLLVVSADRPGELRGVGASQATDQSRLFGTHVRAQVDLEPQEASTTLVGHLTRCVAAACGAPTGTPGPVQINVAFRDPLTPASPASPAASGDEAGASFVPRPTRVLAASPVSARWEDVVGPATAGLIVAGEGASPRALEWSRASGFPLLAEPASGAWAGGGVTPFEQSLVCSPLGREVDTVVVTGRPTLSRPIHALLARPDVRVILVDPHAPWVDVSGNASVVVADLEPARGPIDAAQVEWASRVRDAARDAGERIESLLAAGSGRTMLDLARVVAASSSGPLVLGASNPVRAFDLAVPTLEGRAVHSNRGQAGIDGTIATAVGIAVGAGSVGGATVPASERVTAVMGDLTACHDASSLALAAAARAHLDIIVADDRGGGIFATLEHGRATTPEAYDRWFGVAQTVDYEALAAAYRLAFARVDNPAQLARVLETPQAGPRLVHVPVERGAHLYAAIRDILN